MVDPSDFAIPPVVTEKLDLWEVEVRRMTADLLRDEIHFRRLCFSYRLCVQIFGRIYDSRFVTQDNFRHFFDSIGSKTKRRR